MSIKDNLDIILITYNRKKYLERTFEQIFSNESPIKDFDITILDNCSNDGTYELIEEYKKTHPNIKHIVHNINIGGNANIVRAFEIAKKEYVWVLCDDDFYNWKNWDKVEQEIDKNTDVIVLSNEMLNDKNNIGDIFLQLQLVSAGIYKKDIINTTTITNAYSLIQNYFPHLAFGAYAYKHNKRFFVLEDEQIVIPSAYENLRSNIDMADASFSRGFEAQDSIPDTQFGNWYSNYINSLAILNDTKLVDKCLKSVINNEKRHNIYYQNLTRIIKLILVLSQKNKIGMIAFWNFYCRVGVKTKLLMLYNLFLFLTINIYSTNDGYFNIIIFRKFKFRLKNKFIKINQGAES